MARLRAAQEKVLDRRSEMDELRARRCRAPMPDYAVHAESPGDWRLLPTVTAMESLALSL